MTVGPVAWEWVALTVALAVVGLVAVAYQAAAAGRWMRERWEDWRADAAMAAEDEDDPLEPLPPERSWGRLDSRPVGVVVPGPLEPVSVTLAALVGELRERSPWMAEQRAAYASLGFEYPSGLMARVRELTP